MSPSDRIDDDRLREILAGCEGVTPGPWRCERFGNIQSNECDGRHIVAESDLTWGLNRNGANAAHIARLDPQTVASIVAELLETRAVLALVAEEAGKDNAPLGRSDSFALARIREALGLSRPTKEPAHGK